MSYERTDRHPERMIRRRRRRRRRPKTDIVPRRINLRIDAVASAVASCIGGATFNYQHNFSTPLNMQIVQFASSQSCRRKMPPVDHLGT
ncbi:hypothetical protein PUN28_006313 [Cardiocondyla obscurior]|uniref:Uncharacterized protein n=1 Tax=Cardiocondyla obscurior TaxID=286306 RepID=A0AAW2GDF5_9HYME